MLDDVTTFPVEHWPYFTWFHPIFVKLNASESYWWAGFVWKLRTSPDLETLTLLGFFAWKDGTSMSMNSPYGIFDMFDQQSVVKPKPASSLRGGFPRSLPSPYSCHHLIGIVFVPFCILLCQMSLQSFWGWVLWQSLFLCPKGVELYPAQEEAIVEIFSGAHVAPWYEKLAMGFQGPNDQSKTTSGCLYKNIYLCRYLQYVFTR